MSADLDIQLKLIEYDSDEYHQALLLRYNLFYQEHSIPLASIVAPQEAQDLHFAITAASTNLLLAYGRLAQLSSSEFQIYQMAVLPEYQGRGLGTRILQAMVAAAIRQGAELVTLHARTTRLSFYQKFGFEPVSEVFASSATGVPHIKMQKQVRQLK